MAYKNIFDSTSWEVLSDSIAVKSTDLSALKYNEIRIANEVKDFFSLKNMEKHERREINLIYDGIPYQCIIYLDSYLRGRGKLRWGKKFRNLFQDQVSGYFFDEENLINLPLIRFQKIDALNYDVTLIFLKEIIEESIEIDDRNIPLYEKYKVFEENFNWKIKTFKFHGNNCSICGFNYINTYGSYGKGKCKVFFKGNLNEDREPLVDKELVPICDNCKGLLKSGMSYDELKTIYKIHKEFSNNLKGNR